MQGLQAMLPKLIRHDTFTYVTTSTLHAAVIIAENNFFLMRRLTHGDPGAVRPVHSVVLLPLVQHIVRILTDRTEFSKLEECFVFKLFLLKCICT